MTLARFRSSRFAMVAVALLAMVCLRVAHLLLLDSGKALTRAATNFGVSADALELTARSQRQRLFGIELSGRFDVDDGSEVAVVVRQALPFTPLVVKSYTREF